MHDSDFRPYGDAKEVVCTRPTTPGSSIPCPIAPGKFSAIPLGQCSSTTRSTNGTRFRLESGTLATWTPRDSTGRSPQDTYIVRRAESESKIDWTSPYALPIREETFDLVFHDMMVSLEFKERIYVQRKVIGADPAYALPVCSIVDNPLAAIFIDNMFRPSPDDIGRSRFANEPFYLLVDQYNKLDPGRYHGLLRTLPNGATSQMAIVTDFDRRIGIVFGSSYMGAIKKLMFTVMNFYLPEEGILPLHCSANEGARGDIAVFLGALRYR